MLRLTIFISGLLIHILLVAILANIIYIRKTYNYCELQTHTEYSYHHHNSLSACFQCECAKDILVFYVCSMYITDDVLLKDIKILFIAIMQKMSVTKITQSWSDTKKVKFVITLHANRLLINNFMFCCTNIKCCLE